MNSRLIKVITAVLILANLQFLWMPVYSKAADAVTGDVQTILKSWVSQGFVGGQSDIVLKPNDKMKRIEFYTLMNKIFKYTGKSDIHFTDVVKASWYEAEIQKAVAAGYLKDNTKAALQPFQPIGRLELAACLSYIFKLEPGNETALNSITDIGSLSDENRDVVCSVINKGCMSASADGRFAPWSGITHMDSARSINSLLANIINKQGTYKGDYKNDLVINATGVVVSNSVIRGDLLLTEGIGDGYVTLVNVTVTGRMIVKGGGANSIIVQDSAVNGGLVVDKKGSPVRVAAVGNTSIAETTACPGAILEERNLTGRGFEKIETEENGTTGKEIILTGAFTSVGMNTPDNVLQINGTISNLEAGEGSSNARIVLKSGTIGEFNIKGDSVGLEFTGGLVKLLKIADSANSAKVTLDGTPLITQMDVSSGVYMNLKSGTISRLNMLEGSSGSVIQNGDSADVELLYAYAGLTVNGEGTIDEVHINSSNVTIEHEPDEVHVADGIIANIGGSDWNTADEDSAVTLTYDTSETLELIEGQTSTLAITKSPSSSELSFSTGNPAIATVSTAGAVTGVSEGSTSIYVTGTHKGYEPGSTKVAVKVLSKYTTLPGTITVSPTVEATGTVCDVILTYTSSTEMDSGNVIFMMPAGFTPSDDDTVQKQSSAVTSINESSISVAGQKVTVSDLDMAAGDSIVLTLVQRTMPASGSYTFTARADADGSGTMLTGKDVTVVLTISGVETLIQGKHYTKPEAGPEPGSTTISDLQFQSIPNAALWKIIVQDGAISDTLKKAGTSAPAGAEDYSEGDSIAINAGQHLILLLTNSSGVILAYADITVSGDQISAGALDEDNYSTPVPGENGGTVRITSLSATGISAATNWKIKVQDESLKTTMHVDDKLEGAVSYTAGDDIQADAGQHIILLATDAEGKTKAYADITVTSSMIRASARELTDSDNCCHTPASGADIGTVMIDYLQSASTLMTAQENIGAMKWMFAVQDEALGYAPALDSTMTAARDYTIGQAITVTAGQHLILLATDDSGAIKAYRDFTISDSQIKPQEAILLTPENSAYTVVKGSASGTVKLTGLSVDTKKISGAVQWMIKVQDTALTGAPAKGRVISGTIVYKNTNISVSAGQHLILLATDADGKVKAYADIEITEDMVKAAAAETLIEGTNYSSLSDGTNAGTTKIDTLLKGGYDAVSWWYIVGNDAFAVPTVADTPETYITDNYSTSYSAIQYTAGDNIDVAEGQHILLLAVNAGGFVVAYADISKLQIKGDSAPELTLSEGSTAGNYTVPVKGLGAGTSRIMKLSFDGISGATGWKIKVQDTALSTPELNNTLQNSKTYTQEQDISIGAEQYIVLVAVNSSGMIKAYANIQVHEDQISPAEAPELERDQNYSLPVKGTVQGTTRILILLDTTYVTSGGIWMYKVFSDTPADLTVESKADSTYTIYDNTADPNIPVKAYQWLQLVRVSSDYTVKAYVNLQIGPDQIKGSSAQELVEGTIYNYSKPVAGTTPGTTCITTLSAFGVQDDVTKWSYKVQDTAMEAPDYNSTKLGFTSYSANGNISISAGQYIVLLATDNNGKIKGYANILVDSSQIKPAWAKLLEISLNYSKPEAGSVTGTTMISFLQDKAIVTSGGAWMIKVQDKAFDQPAVEDKADGFTAYTAGDNINITLNQHLILVRVNSNMQIKGYVDLQIKDSAQIKASGADTLVKGVNYWGPVAGTAPGTTQFTELEIFGYPDITQWWATATNVDTSAPDYNSLVSVYNNVKRCYESTNIAVSSGQDYLLLFGTESGGRIKAYASIPLEAGQVTSQAAMNLALYPNKYYSIPIPGSNMGTTQIKLINEDLTGTGVWQYMIQDGAFAIPLLDSKATAASAFTAKTDMPATGTVKAGQHLLLLAVDTEGRIKAYEDITLKSDQIKAIGAVKLEMGTADTSNFSEPEPGITGGTTTITTLQAFGITGATKWQVLVQDTALSSAPALDSRMSGAVFYTKGSDITAAVGKYLVLLATDDAGNIKGYSDILLESRHVKSAAGSIPEGYYTTPSPGNAVGTTEITTLGAVSALADDSTTSLGAIQWRIVVRGSSIGSILKDTVITEAKEYPAGDDIAIADGQYLVLLATDGSGKVKAYKEFTIVKSQIRGVTVDIAGTVVSPAAAESDIVTGGRTLVIKLQYAKWISDIASGQTSREALFGSFTAASDATEWSKAITAMKAEGTGCIVRTSDDTVTITMPEISTYNIASNQTVTLTVPASLLVGSPEIIASASFTIAASVGATISGTTVSSATGEADIAAGGKTIVVTLTSGQWAADIASSEEKRFALFNSFTASVNKDEWDNKVIAALISKANADTAPSTIVRNSSSKITITLPKADGYDIHENETVSLTIPKEKGLITGAASDTKASPDIKIYCRMSADITGSAVESDLDEADIVTGGKTIIVTLSDAKWASDLKTDSTKRNALFSGFTTATETTEWAKVINALKTDGAQAISMNAELTEVKITLPTISGYNIASDQTVTLSIPASVVSGAAAVIAAAPEIKIAAVQSAAITGTAATSSPKETDIVAGGKTIIITLSSCQWAADVVTNATKREALINSFTSTTDSDEWKKVTAAIVSKTGSVVRSTNYQATITLPAVAGYNISEDQTVNLAITTSSALLADTSVSIALPSAFTVANTPPAAATVSSVTATTANGTYKAGDTIHIIVTFNNTVDVDTTGGIPELQLETGTTDRYAVYTSGSGLNVLMFDYAVQAGDTASKLEYKATSALTLNSGTIRNTGTSVSATLTLPTLNTANSLGGSKTIVIDTTAPVYTTGYPKIKSTTETSTDVLVKAGEGGSAYYVVLAQGAAAPTSQQTAEGKSADGTTAGAITAGSISISANAESTLSIGNLTAKTSYDIYVVCKDAVGNLQAAPTKVSAVTTDTTPPEFISGYPQEGTIADTTAEIKVRINENGTVYIVLLPAGSATPSAVQVKAGKNAAGTAVALNLKASLALEADTVSLYKFTGLTMAAEYDVYIAAEDTAGNIQTSPVKLPIKIELKFDGVSKDVGAGVITGTSIYMEYSLDSLNLDDSVNKVEGTWKSCTAGSTAVTFTAGQVWVREVSDHDNIYRVGDAIAPAAEAPILNQDIKYNDVDNTIMKNNGSVLDSTFEYRIGTGSWVSGEISGDFSGTKTVWVRYKGTKTALPSLATGIYFTENLDLTKVSVNVANGKILNTADTMQYSFTSTNGTDGTWFACTAGSTDVTFVAGKVYVRAAAQPDASYLAAVVKLAKSPDLSGISYNIGAGTITGTQDDAQYRIDGGNWTNVTVGGTTTNIAFAEGQIELRTGASVTLLPSGPVSLGTVAEPAAAPTVGTPGAIGIDVEYDNDQNTLTTPGGIILGKDYEYRINGGLWVLGDVVGDFKGTKTVQVRKKGTASKLPSLSATVIFTANTLSIDAVDSGSNIGLGTGDKIVITFEEATNTPTVSAINLSDWFQISNGHSWGSGLKEEDIAWNTSGTALTVTLSTTSGITIVPGDTVTVSSAAAIKNKAGTSPASTASGEAAGSYSSIKAVAYNSASQAGQLEVGDKIVITFTEDTNKPEITAANLDTWFRADNGHDMHFWGTGSTFATCKWTSGNVLTITFSDVTGSTIVPGDTITLLLGAGITSESDLSKMCTAVCTITGKF
jgi:hypothetical protein